MSGVVVAVAPVATPLSHAGLGVSYNGVTPKLKKNQDMSFEFFSTSHSQTQLPWGQWTE